VASSAECLTRLIFLGAGGLPSAQACHLVKLETGRKVMQPLFCHRPIGSEVSPQISKAPRSNEKALTDEGFFEKQQKR